MGAIAAGGKVINFDKKTIKDKKTGKVSTFKKTSKGIIIKPKTSSSKKSAQAETVILSTKEKEIQTALNVTPIVKAIDKPKRTYINLIGNEGIVRITDDRTGYTTTQRINLNTGGIISEKKSLSRAKGIIEPKPKETIQQKVAGFSIPKKNDNKLTRTFRLLNELIAQPTVDLFVFLGLSPKKKVEVIKNIVNDKDLVKNIGIEIGKDVNSQDPFKNVRGTLNAVLLVSGTTQLIRGIAKYTRGQVRNVINSENVELNNIKAKIKDLKDEGVNTRQKTNKASDLRNLEEQKRIIEADIKELTDKIELSAKKVEINPSKNNNKNFKNVVDDVSKKHKSRKKRRSNLKQKLNDKTIAKGIKLVSAPTKKPKIKVIKNLPKSKTALNKLLLEARKKGGKEFSQLKARIKRELNLNVVQRGKGKNIRYELLEPKEQRKKGVKTGGKKKVKLVTEKGRVIDIGKRKGKKQKDKKELTAKEKKKLQKDLEFEDGQNLDKLRKDLMQYEKSNVRTLFNTKKGQLTFKTSVKKVVKKDTQKVNNVKNKSNKVYKKYNGKPVKRKPFIETKRKAKQEISQAKKKIKSDITIMKKSSKSFKAMKVKPTILSIMKQAQAQLTKLLNELEQSNDKLNKISPKFPKTPPRTPNKPTRTPTKPPKKPPSKPRTKPTPTKPPKKPPSKPRKIKKPRVLPKPKLKLSKDDPTKNKLGAIRYREGNKVKTIKTGLPYNQALRVASKVVDNTRRASMTVVAYGKTNKITSKPKLSKFRLKKSKNKLVQKLVEKRKYRIDTRGEVKDLSLAKSINKQIKLIKSKKKGGKKNVSKKK